MGHLQRKKGVPCLKRYRTCLRIATGNVIKILNTIFFFLSANLLNIRRRACRGTPQSGALSPLLWNIAVKELLVNLQRNVFMDMQMTCP